MMKTRSALLAVLLLAASAASATIIDFNAPIAPTASYSESGVTFTPIGGGTLDNPISPNATRALLEESSPRHEIRADITGGTSFVSVDLGDFNADPDLLFLEIYDSADNLLDSATLLIAADFTGMMTLSLSHAGIAYAIFGARAPAVNGNSVFADNFTFAAAPEPASLALAGVALLALLAVRRTQR